MNKEKDLMKIALEEAKSAYGQNEIPVGCVVVDENFNFLCSAHNQRESTKQISRHAEIIALEKAAQILGSWRLSKCKIFVTLEPCLMCLTAIVQSGIKDIYIGCKREGNEDLKLSLLSDYLFDKGFNVKRNILNHECSKILKDFFEEKRNKNTKNS
ncbi:MAG: nucleoside deaminase [Candidatus Onthovivens sp.]|nr:nucleoside deaminase [Candidatus Onthovivens sp.]